MKLLIVEDDRLLSNALARSLRDAYAVDQAFDGEEGLFYAAQDVYDLVVLDVMLPERDGFSVLEALRAQGVDTPVLMLTARSATADKLRGLRSGADDYLAKPFDRDELLARIEAVLRRSPERPRQLREIRIPGASLDSANRLLTFEDGKETSLTAREFEFLTYMATHPNRVITRDELLRRVWDVDPRLTDTRSVEMTVMRLRDKLGTVAAAPLETLRSQGYRWNSSFVS